MRAPEADARSFAESMKDRLKAFKLEVEPTKTALHRFGDLAPALCKRDGHRRPVTFDFLGFTHYFAIRRGRARLTRKTQAERMRKQLKTLSARFRALRTQGAGVMRQYVRDHVLVPKIRRPRLGNRSVRLSAFA